MNFKDLPQTHSVKVRDFISIPQTHSVKVGDFISMPQTHSVKVGDFISIPQTLCVKVGDFISIPLELYGEILNFMSNPLILSLVNKELYNLLNNSVYGKCYNHIFRLKDPRELISKEYKYVVKLDVLFDINKPLINLTDDQLKKFPNLQELNCHDCPNLTDKSISKLIKLKKFVCFKCGDIDAIVIERETLNCRQNKRVNHLSEWLSQFRAEESPDIPQEVYDTISKELQKNKFYNLEKLTILDIKKILKKLNFTKYYEHTRHIVSKLSKLPLQTISRDIERRLKYMFILTNISYEKHRPRHRISFFSYSYILRKFFQLLDLDNFLKYFPLFFNREKLKYQDKIWEKICK